MKSKYNSIYLHLHKHKIVIIVISFILGIVLNEYIELSWYVIATLAVIAALLSLIIRKLSFLLFIPLGIAFSANSQMVFSNNILNYAGEKIDLEGVLYKSPETSVSGTRLYLDTKIIYREGIHEPVSGKIIIHSNDRSNLLAYGEKIRLLDLKIRRIEKFKNPGSFDIKRFYERQGIYARGFVDGEESIISFGLSESYSPILNSIDKIRMKFGNFVKDKYQPPLSSILNAITIGQKGAIPKDVRTEFSKAGVAHILAISGLHVGAVAIVFFFLIKWLLKRSEYLLLRFQIPRLAAAMTILPIYLYTAVAGFSTSTVRAFIMISLYLISIVLGKEQYRINILSAAALIILVWEPWSLFELSFQLSFSAVLAILITNKVFPYKFNTIEDKFYSLIKTTVAASLATFPLVANSFGVLPLVSIPANVMIVPFVEFVIVPISLISFIGYLISPDFAEILISINIFLIEILIFGVKEVLKIPYSSLTIPIMNSISWMMFLLLVVSIVLGSVYKKIRFAIPFLILGLILALIKPLTGNYLDSMLEVNILDAGANKSFVYIKSPNRKNIFIVGGYSINDRNGYLEKTVATNYLLNDGVRNIDTLILNSIDKDTLNGAVHLIEKFNVRTLYTNGDKLSGELWKTIYKNKIILEKLSNVNELKIAQGLTLHILKPGKDYVVDDSSIPSPIILRLVHEGNSFLMGESIIQPSVQKEMLELYGNEIDSTVLYIPNITKEKSHTYFIKYLSPMILITGNTEITESQLKEITSNEDVQILLTDKNGKVTITFEGGELKVRSFTDEKEFILH